MKMNKKGFTLIELLAVIVILAIIALIATPIIMNVITNAQESADARSVESYGKELESQYYQWMVKNPGVTVTDTVITNTIVPAAKMNGNTVSCTAPTTANFATDGTVTLSGCTVNGRGTYAYNSKTGASKS